MKLFDILNSKGFKIICSFALIIYVAVTVYSQSNTIKESNRILDSYKANISEQEETKRDLAEEKAQVGTDEYIEKVARDKLGMCKENEKIFIDGKDN